MKSGKSLITLTDLKNAVKEVPFRPNLPGPMAVLLEANDHKYWEQRAIEILKDIVALNVPNDVAIDRLNTVQRLIALSVAKRKKDTPA